MVPPATKPAAPATPKPPTPAWRRVLFRVWPWLVALAILGALFARIPRQALLHALETGPWFSLGLYTWVQWLLLLTADSFAIRISLAITGFRERFARIVLARGATYMLGLVNYALGQGALGVYLQRSGVAALRAAGTMIFLLTVNLGVLLVIAGLGFWAGGSPQTAYLNLAPLFYGLGLGMVLYLAAVGWQPRALQDYQVLAPLMQAGLGGHLRAAAARLPHLLFLVLAYWGALRLWGIPVPLAQGLAVVPVVLLVNAVPITPLGLGTTQAALVLLFSPFVPLPDPEVRAAVVLAFSLTYYLCGIVAQVLIGLWCFQKIRAGAGKR
jgi:uncharacterized membrane protein YbhN (UPF0104 family)